MEASSACSPSVPAQRRCDELVRGARWRAPRTTRSALAPGGLWKDDGDRAGCGGRQHLDELRPSLPLENEVRGHDVLADGVELRGPLHSLHCHTAVQV